MKIGMIGLGRMGSNMARRIVKSGHSVIGYDPQINQSHFEAIDGITITNSVSEMTNILKSPRIIWVMVPAGHVTDTTIESLVVHLDQGDIIVDGGNSNYKDSVRRAHDLQQIGIVCLDIGVSGGIWGLSEGYSMMVGGDKNAFKALEPILQSLAPSANTGYGHVGPSGSGHFVKMMHNGIEYGMMQAFAEGFEIIKSKEEFHLDLTQISDIWRHGSVVRSWLLDLITSALKEEPGLESIDSYVEDSGEGRWAVQEGLDLNVPTPVISASLQTRFRSRQQQPFAGKLLASMRNQFGGHDTRKNTKLL